MFYACQGLVVKADAWTSRLGDREDLASALQSEDYKDILERGLQVFI